MAAGKIGLWRLFIFFNCNNLCEARTKEQEYFILLKATLNSIEPMPSGKPLPAVIETPNVAQGSSKFSCKLCDFDCSKYRDWSRHLSTTKHTVRTNTSETPAKITGESSSKSPPEYSCDCGRKYKHASSLWNHRHKCKTLSQPIVDASNNCVINKELVMLLIKENSELKNMILEEHKSTKQIMMDTQNQIAEVLKIFTHNQ